MGAGSVSCMVLGGNGVSPLVLRVGCGGGGAVSCMCGWAVHEVLPAAGGPVDC